MSFESRMAQAQAFEAEVSAELTLRGWDVASFGQGLLTREARQILGHHAHAQHRWLPDMVAYHPRRDRHAMIDAKSCAGPNYSIEKSSLSALVEHEQTAVMPVYIVFSDWATIRATELWDLTDTSVCRTGPPPTRGSGTPYWLIRKGAIHTSFDDVFGTPQIEGNGAT